MLSPFEGAINDGKENSGEADAPLTIEGGGNGLDFDADTADAAPGVLDRELCSLSSSLVTVKVTPDAGALCGSLPA